MKKTLSYWGLDAGVVGWLFVTGCGHTHSKPNPSVGKPFLFFQIEMSVRIMCSIVITVMVVSPLRMTYHIGQKRVCICKKCSVHAFSSWTEVYTREHPWTPVNIPEHPWTRLIMTCSLCYPLQRLSGPIHHVPIHGCPWFVTLAHPKTLHNAHDWTPCARDNLKLAALQLCSEPSCSWDMAQK